MTLRELLLTVDLNTRRGVAKVDTSAWDVPDRLDETVA